jgi:hypothetical protein
MLKEFLDITKDSKAMFEGLAIMDTRYADLINTRPVIYFTFKNCQDKTEKALLYHLSREIFWEYSRYHTLLKDRLNADDDLITDFLSTYQALKSESISSQKLSGSLALLIKIAADYYDAAPALLIDEYDQPIMSSYEHGYREELGSFFSNFYGFALKSCVGSGRALLTGIQRVAKESIFSQVNNIRVFSVADKEFASHFGLTHDETKTLLEYYDLELTDDVKQMYDGYKFGGVQMYNPWAISEYADRKTLEPYWINTSTNVLIKEKLKMADENFLQDFQKLMGDGHVLTVVDLKNAYMEKPSNAALWGLFLNAGYVTIEEKIDANLMSLKIPNGEVKNEFVELIEDHTHVSGDHLKLMLFHLTKGNAEEFIALYKQIILRYVSCHDVGKNAENPYHMLFLGMVLALDDYYEVTSNIEHGHGRSDIRLKALQSGKMNVVIEFKFAEDEQELKSASVAALQQINDKKYYIGLSGDVLCLGIAHSKKKCEIASEKKSL